jgi:hypothetical protein
MAPRSSLFSLFAAHLRASVVARVLPVLALPLAAGCATGNGSFKADGFHHNDYPYVVHYGTPAAREFLGPDWRIDNYIVSSDGSPGQAKTAAGYRGIQELDLDGDGKPDNTEVYYFDLKLANRKTSAVIWIQAIPLGQEESERNLRVLMDHYVEAIAGTGLYALKYQEHDTDRDALKQVRARTYAAKVVDSKETKVKNLEAFEATIELANLDQLRFDPSHRASVARVILVRTDYFKDWVIDAKDMRTRAVLRVGYEADPQDFQAGMPDFERFLSLLEFGPPKD